MDEIQEYFDIMFTAWVDYMEYEDEEWLIKVAIPGADQLAMNDAD